MFIDPNFDYFKVFFADTLKFFLSLYGHKLPVTAMDVSADSALIATGGADKNLKARLPDGDSQILRLYVLGPSGLKDYGSATLRCKI